MNRATKILLPVLLSSCFVMSCTGASKESDESIEPSVEGSKAVELIQESSLKGWEVPSDNWSIEKGVIIGDTKEKKLTKAEWIYTEQTFSDFVFTCEVKLTGPESPNSGIYFRARKIPYINRKGVFQYDAATGYEYDLVPDKYFGSIGDWFSRPKFRIYADKTIIDKQYKANEWNRVTLRARGNRVEYWLNGIKIQDFKDLDPKGSREGLIALQLHDKIVMKVQYRNARVLPLD
jgi:hypothetical protein